MWIFEQKTGHLLHEGEYIATGYSGHGDGRCCPEKQSVPQVGPIPVGHYEISGQYQHPAKGPVVMRLTPAPENKMFGRSGFLIHGDSIAKPGTASEGCIILGRPIREKIAKSPDKELLVVSGV
jgi:hypothetical protein